MDWKKPRSNLNILTGDLNYLGKQKSGSTNWRKLRARTLKHRNNTCRYCGGEYSKYMICFHLDENPKNLNKDNMDIACRLCYITTHINYGHMKDVIVCYSKLDQFEIVRKTIDYVIENDYIPEPSKIDSDVKKPPLSLMELCSILIENDNCIPKELQNYKIFFTNEIDLTFTDFYKKKSNSMFDDPTDSPYMFQDSDDEEEIPKEKEESYIPLHVPSNKEIKCLDKIFDKTNNRLTNKNMKDKLNFIEKISKLTSKRVSVKDINQKFPYVSSTKESSSNEML
jgi:hypothetical protein